MPGEGLDFQSHYREIMDILRQENDAMFGINSYRQGNAWVRDATAAKDLKDFPNITDPKIERNQLYMRALSRLRAVDYALEHSDVASSESLRETLKASFASMLESEHPDEKAFDDDLIEVLHQAGLTDGVVDIKGAKKLLGRYRLLSSLIDPALTLITATYDKNLRILQREVQRPITEKTTSQVEAIESLNELNAHPIPEEKNAHNSSKLAMQKADKIFASLLAKDDRMLGAQSRKTHAVSGARNAYIVNLETEIGVDAPSAEMDYTQPLQDDEPLSLVRMGVPVYIGKGEQQKDIDTYTMQIMNQVRIAANKNQKLHFTVLNTNMAHGSQDKMIAGMGRAIKQGIVPDAMSVVPVNDIGTASLPELSPDLEHESSIKQRKPGKKIDRLDDAVSVILNARDEGYTSCLNCASGQDRTGTVVERTAQTWTMKKWREKYGDKTVLSQAALESQVQQMRARGFNAAEIASHTLPGSPGLKSVSRAYNLFESKTGLGAEAEKVLYRDSSLTNTSNPVSNRSAEILQRPSVLALNEFHEEMRALQAACLIGPDDGAILKDVKQAGVRVWSHFMPSEEEEHDNEEYQENIGHALWEVTHSIEVWAKRKVQPLIDAVMGKYGIENSYDLYEMTQAVRYTRKAVLAFTGEVDINAIGREAKHINLVRKGLPGHTDFGKMLGAVAIVTVVGCIAAAILLSNPFSAVMFVGAGIVGAALMMTAAGFLGYAARNIVLGAKVLLFAGQEKDHAAEMRKFKKVIKAKAVEHKQASGKPSFYKPADKLDDKPDEEDTNEEKDSPDGVKPKPTSES